ncbi:MAG TPA: hypothetical protein VLG66_06560 [Alphaproteobacteria bacterium]|nr:hypothetical protein [Alphaproteobacteria bacterium]
MNAFLKPGLGIVAAALLWAGAASCAEPYSTAGWEVAFARRDFQLGTTLSQFRATPFPDQGEWPGAFPICSNDPKAERDINFYEARLYDETLRRAGLVKCRYFYLSKGASLRTPTPAGLMLVDVGATTEFFFLKPEGAQDHILFWITSGGPTGRFHVLAETFIAAYGPPQADHVERWQTLTGTASDNRILVWSNEASEMELRELGDTAHVFRLTHRLKSLFAVLDRRIQRINRDNSRKY